MKKILLLSALVLALLFAGCIQPGPPGSDRDAYGCIPSAGYQWCNATQKCYRSWEENCTAPIVGGDKDAYGCIPSAGYQWCEASQKCIRAWEENCTAAQPMPGSDKDAHGCIPSAGYSWCESKQKCYRPWEENCTGLIVGNDSDVHGCKASAGYSWCEAKQKCIRSWEENCTGSSLEPEARTYCGKQNVDSVYVCGPFIRVVSSLLGGGSTFYDSNNTKITQCPVVGPDSMSEQCKQLLLGNNCAEQKVC
ncbi:MAG: hypothetical protein V1492_03085 [Candidatus Micrarchaeota archaeon]